jgi:hypothetical protein
MPVIGQWYQLLSDYGAGVGMLKAVYVHQGEERQRMVQVIDVPEVGTPGTGYVDTPSPLVRWHQHTPEGIAVHHSQIHADTFAELFAEGSEPPEESERAAQDGEGA